MFYTRGFASDMNTGWYSIDVNVFNIFSPVHLRALSQQGKALAIVKVARSEGIINTIEGLSLLGEGDYHYRRSLPARRGCP
jgi:hypothetical protein